MDLESSPHLDEFRAQVRKFVEQNSPLRRVHTGVRAPEPEDMPALRRWVAALFEAGYLGIDWPEEWGGRPDAHPLEAFVVAEELARARAWLPSGAGSLAAGAFIDFGTEEQRARYLPRIRSGEDIWCQLFSEPGAGSDLASLQTRARRDGDSFVVDGQKVWTTTGHLSDLGYLLARTNPDAPKHKGITAFAVEMSTPGIDVRPLREITGTSDFNEVFLDSVVVPAENVIGSVDDGWRVATSSLMHERHSVAGSGVELFHMLADLVDLAAASEADGRPALESDATRRELGRLSAVAQVNYLLNQNNQSNLLHGTSDVADAPLNKIVFSELNLAMTEAALRLQGSDSIIVEGDDRAVAHGWWQDAFLYARAYTIAGGANEVMRNLIAERSLRLPKDPTG